jgi:hypothetical protein
MADARMKSILMKLADLSSRTNYLIDLLTNLREPLSTSDEIEVPSIGAMTVTASGAAGVVTAQSITADVLRLQANLDPAIFVNLPLVDQTQILDGKWAGLVSAEMLTRLKNSIDSQIIAYFAGTVAYDSAGAYHGNRAGAAATVQPALTVAVLNDFTAEMEALEGTLYDNLAWFIHPMAKSVITSNTAFIPQVGDEAQKTRMLGLRTIGWLNGIPVYISQSAPRGRTVASSAWAITGTTTRTITVPAGHGIVPGMVCSFATPTAGGILAAPGRVVDSVTATTIVISGTGLTNASATEVGTVTIRACEAMLVDRAHCYVAQQVMPRARMVAEARSTNDVAQVTTIYGRLARPGRVRTLLTPLQAA